MEDRVEHVIDGVLEDLGIARVVRDPLGYRAFVLRFLGTCRNDGGNWRVIAACFVTGFGGTGGRGGVGDGPGVGNVGPWRKCRL